MTNPKGVGQKEKWMENLLESDRPGNQIHGGLLALGRVEAAGDMRGIKGLGWRAARVLTVFTAKYAFHWSDNDIKATIDEGRRLERDLIKEE